VIKPSRTVTKISTIGLSVIALAGILSGCTQTIVAPDRALVEALAQLIEAKSWVATSEISIDAVPLDTPLFSNTFEEVMVDLQVRYSRSRSNRADVAVGISATSAKDEQAAAEFRLVDEQLQLALTALPDTGEVDLSSLLGTAFYIPTTQAEQLLPLLQERSSLERAAMATVFRETPDLFTNIQELEEDSVEGATARHFSAQLNIDAVNRILTQIAAIQGAQPQLLKPGQLDTAPLELWTNKRSGALVKFSGELADPSGRSGMVEVVFSNINKRVKVEPLDNVRLLTFDELIKLLDTPADQTSDTIETSKDDSADAQLPTESDQTNNTVGSAGSSGEAPNTDSGNTTTEFVPEVPFPIQ